jgi:hypothetical protein
VCHHDVSLINLNVTILLCLVLVTILFYLKFLKVYLGDRSVIEKVIENLPNPNGAGHSLSPNDSRFLAHPVLIIY